MPGPRAMTRRTLWLVPMLVGCWSGPDVTPHPSAGTRASDPATVSSFEAVPFIEAFMQTGGVRLLQRPGACVRLMDDISGHFNGYAMVVRNRGGLMPTPD